jgi:hypothetical protein
MLDSVSVTERIAARDQLASLVELEASLPTRKIDAVRRCRQAGLTWEAIALVLGVSKQAAHQLYARHINH